MDYFFFYAALASYAGFGLTAVLFKIGDNKTPLASINKLHAQFTLFYVAGSLSLHYFIDEFTYAALVKFIIGFFCYFLVHYALILNFFSLAQRSISSMLLLLFEKTDTLSEEEFDKRYAQGRGIQYVKQSRLEDLVNLGWIKEVNGLFSLTGKGRFVCKVISLFLRSWGLRQLGDRRD